MAFSNLSKEELEVFAFLLFLMNFVQLILLSYTRASNNDKDKILSRLELEKDELELEIRNLNSEIISLRNNYNLRTNDATMAYDENKLLRNLLERLIDSIYKRATREKIVPVIKEVLGKKQATLKRKAG